MREAGTVTVYGHAVVRVPSTQAEVSLAIDTVRPDPSTAFADTARTVAAALALLADAGIPQQAVRTVGLQLGPRTSYRDGAEVLLGYGCSQRLVVAIQRLDVIPELLGRLVGTDPEGVRLEGVSFSAGGADGVSDTVWAQARRAAVADGQVKAQDYARLVGRDVGAVVSVCEVDPRNDPGPAPKMHRLAAAAMPVAPGESEVALTVQLQVELV